MTYTVDPVKINKIFQKCEGKIEEAAEDIVNDTPSYTGNSIGSLVLAMFQRPFFKMASKKPLKSVFKVDNEKCTKCMRCIQICPEGNIKLADGTIAFGKNCSLCMRCYNYCPQTAILGYGVKHNDKKPPYKGPADFDPALITPQKNLMDYIE
jgi:ferredoxin